MPADGFKFSEREKAIMEGEDVADLGPLPEGEQQEDLPEKIDPEMVIEDDPPENEEAGEEAEAPEESTEEDSSEPEEQDWVSEVAELAASYGMDEDEVRETFKSKEEFERLSVVMDKQQALYMRQPESTPESYEKQPEPEEPSEVPGLKADGTLDLEWLQENGYDETSIAMFKKVHTLEQQAREQQAYVLAKEQYARDNAFHDSLDVIDPEFFGKSVDDDGNPIYDLPKEYADRRGRLAKEVRDVLYPQMVQQNLKKGIVSEPNMRLAVKRGINLVFGKEMAERESRKRGEALKKQAARRRPVNSTSQSAAARAASKRPSDEVITKESQVEELVNDEVLVNAWNNFR